MRLIPLALACAALSGCAIFGPGTVTRKVHGRIEEGRFVSQTAYAAYFEGAEAESRHDWGAAEAAYLRVAALDDESADVWARIGAVRCAALPKDEPANRALDAFRRATTIDPTFAPAYRDEARCELRLGALDAALASAKASLEHDPTDETTSLLVASIHEAAGRPVEARRWLAGLVARDPTLGEAKRELARLESLTSPPRAALATLDDAIRAGDLATARRRALSLHVSSASLALRAAALGAASIALEQSRLVLDADPSSSDARVALLVTSDLLRDEPLFRRALEGVPSSTTPPSPLARALLADVLARRASRSTASTFRGLGPDEPGADPLVADVFARTKPDTR